MRATWVLSPGRSLLSLTALEVVLGIENIVFITILVARLPEGQRQRARIIGLSLAMVTRILLLLSLAWVMRLVQPLFTIFGEVISVRDMILIAGGLFLLAKSTHEVHKTLEGPASEMLALSFLILIGTALIGEGLGMHIPKGYIYFAMAFSMVVQMLNLRVRAKQRHAQ